MTNTPTAEEFLAQPDLDDEEMAEPLGSIAESLRQLVELTRGTGAEEQESDRLRVAYDDLEAQHGSLLGLLEEVQALVKPSTSKLANSVRDAINRWNGIEPAEEAPERVAELGVPERDAPVEEWSAYARDLGHHPGNIAGLNRSQIRTLLGIEHTA